MREQVVDILSSLLARRSYPLLTAPVRHLHERARFASMTPSASSKSDQCNSFPLSQLVIIVGISSSD